MTRLSRHFTIALAALVLSSAAFADGGHGLGPGGFGEPAGAGPGRLLVAPDGKVLFVQRTTTTSGSTTSMTEKLVALSTSGAVAWTWTPPAGIHEIAFTTGIVAVSVGGDPTSRTTTTTSQIVGVDLSTGAAAWTLTPDGNVEGLEAGSNGILAVIVKSVAATSTTPASVTRTLESITPAGAVAWTYLLD
jgi:hypothetical protein